MIKHTIPVIGDVLVRLKRVLILVSALVLIPGASFLVGGTASAFQMTNRSVAISTGIAGATVNFTFTFTPNAGSTTLIQSLKFSACTTPLGTCTAPSGIDLASGTVGQSGFGGTQSFAKDTTTAGCTTAN